MTSRKCFLALPAEESRYSAVSRLASFSCAVTGSRITACLGPLASAAASVRFALRVIVTRASPFIWVPSSHRCNDSPSGIERNKTGNTVVDQSGRIGGHHRKRIWYHNSPGLGGSSSRIWKERTSPDDAGILMFMEAHPEIFDLFGKIYFHVISAERTTFSCLWS